MKCKQCEYRLWALPGRACPECGAPFRPSDYEFVPGSVRFCCPHCQQPYYGTDAHGHLVPPEFDCVSCGRHIHMDEMVLFPAEGIGEELTKPEVMPWLDRKKLGSIRAWFRMVGMGLVAPSRLMELTPVESSVGQAWWFMLVTQVIFSLAMAPVFLLIPLGFLGGPGRAGPVLGLSAGFGTICLGWIAALALAMLLWGGVVQFMLNITGGARYGVGRTYHALCYASGAHALAGIPCIGFYLVVIPLAPLWWIVSATIAVKEGQRVSGARAALAVLVLPVLVAAGAVVLSIWAHSVASRAGVFATSMPVLVNAQAAQARSVQDALQAYLSDEQQLPAHAVELITGDYLMPSHVVMWNTPQRGPRAPVLDATLGTLPRRTPEERRAFDARIKRALPAGVVAHRLGDCVFTYHGIDPAKDSPRLWMFGFWPSPFDGQAIRPSGTTTVGLADGTVIHFSDADLATRLQEQNELRRQHGLAPLPSPNTVTHEAPAVAAPVLPAETEPSQ